MKRKINTYLQNTRISKNIHKTTIHIHTSVSTNTATQHHNKGQKEKNGIPEFKFPRRKLRTRRRAVRHWLTRIPKHPSVLFFDLQNRNKRRGERAPYVGLFSAAFVASSEVLGRSRRVRSHEVCRCHSILTVNWSSAVDVDGNIREERVPIVYVTVCVNYLLET